MNTDDGQKKLSRLARVRENQRKGRARKQEYVQELEHRLASAKSDAKQKDIERKLFVQKIEAENRKLRGFLTSLGMQPSDIETYLHMGDNSNIARKMAIPALQGSAEASKLPYQKSRRTRPCSYQCGPQDNTSFAEPLEQPVPNGSCQQTPGCAKNNAPYVKRPEDPVRGAACQQSPRPIQNSTSFAGPAEQPVVGGARQQSPGIAKDKSPSLKRQRNSIPGATCQQSYGPSQECIQEGHDSQPLSTDESFCGCPPIDGELDPWPFNDEVSNSTLCAVAEQLVNQCNIRGVDIAEIRRKLRPGFSRGRRPGEGCRVQNNTLFEVLDEISNG